MSSAVNCSRISNSSAVNCRRAFRMHLQQEILFRVQGDPLSPLLFPITKNFLA
ncbi:hypothetical protein MTR_2g047868 [Medicago truncatula]|uniref:Uncharacterized protein n=1 Tax=Medicago truncatula TaxID=3880 RepID=A0A072V845_MEDTR|nr:hypothetical protein MTR_2g047868 [Medicago truncatula]